MEYNSDLLSNLGQQATICLIHDLKTRVGMFKNIGEDIPGGNLMGGNFPGGSLMGGIFRVGVFLILYLTSTFSNVKS